MTLTPATARLPTPKEWRSRTFSSLGNFSELAAMPWAVLRDIEIFPGIALGSPLLTVPAEWLPMNSTQRAPHRSVDPAEAGVPNDTALAARRDEAVRRALLALWLPGMTETGVRTRAPSTWISNSNLLLKLARWHFDNLSVGDGSVFRGFTVPILINHVYPALAPGQRARDDINRVLGRLIDAGNRGVVSDWPEVYDTAPERSDAPTIEDIVVGAPEIARAELTEERNFKPFSDVFVTEFMRRAAWIQENLGEQVIRLWLDLRKVTDVLGLASKHPSVVAVRADMVDKADWLQADGHRLHDLPFPLHYADGPSTSWPPRGMRGINRIVSLIQALNISVVALCTGARSSEIAAAKDDDIQTSDDRFHSRTFKFSDRRGGEPRDWPLHPFAVRAIQLQRILAAGVRTEGNHLWVTIHDGRPMLNLTEPLAEAVAFLGLDHLTGDDRAHMHRWRHTVARLVAASVAAAPHVLMDLFGHSDLEQTLTYMCSDPDIVGLALKISKETAYVVSGEAVIDAISAQAGGAAAEPLKTNLNAMAMRRGEQEFATADLRETIEVMTFHGRTWSIVRPGVICTKNIGQFGPCTRGRGAPDPATCRTSCDHRLETTRAKRDCRDTLELLIVERAHAVETGFDMLTARLDGEITAHLARFDDVRKEVLDANPAIKSLWEGAR